MLYPAELRVRSCRHSQPTRVPGFPSSASLCQELPTFPRSEGRGSGFSALPGARLLEAGTFLLGLLDEPRREAFDDGNQRPPGARHELNR